MQLHNKWLWREKDELIFAELLCTVKAFCPRFFSADRGLAKYWKRWIPDRFYCPPLLEDEQSLERVLIKRSDQRASKQAKNSSTLILTVKLQTKYWKNASDFVHIKYVQRYVTLQFVYSLNIETWRIKQRKSKIIQQQLQLHIWINENVTHCFSFFNLRSRSRTHKMHQKMTYVT